MSTFDAEIVLDPNNIPNLVLDNYYKDQIDLKSVINKGKQFNFRNTYNTYTRSQFFYQNQDDNQQYVFVTGSTIDFTIAKQYDQMIDQIKYYFSLTNNNTTATNINLYQNPCAYIEYVAVYVNNKEIQKIDTQQLNLINLMQIKETASQLKLYQLNYNQSTLAQNNTVNYMINLGTFLQDSLIHFENIGDIKIRIKFYPDQLQNVQNLQLSQSFLVVETFQLTVGMNDYVIKNQKNLDYRYLDIDRKDYWLPSVNANQVYKIKLSSNCLASFILIQSQLTQSQNAINTRLNSYLPIKNVQLTKIGQNLQVTEIIDYLVNDSQLTKHFKNYYCFQDPTSPIFNQTFLMNFSLNPDMTMNGSIAGAQEISKDNYDLNISFQNTYNQQVTVTVYIFYYQVVNLNEKKQVQLLISP